MDPLDRIFLITLAAYLYIWIFRINLQLSSTGRTFYLRHFHIPPISPFYVCFMLSLLFPINLLTKLFYRIHPADRIILFPFVGKMMIRYNPWVAFPDCFYNL